VNPDFCNFTNKCPHPIKLCEHCVWNNNWINEISGDNDNATN